MMDTLRSAEKLSGESEEKYHKLFELESDAIFLIDNGTGNILEVNEAACELYGFNRDELLKMNHTDLSEEPGETRRVTLEGKTYIPVRWHHKKDHTVFPVEIAANHFQWQGRPVHLAAIRDITERMHADDMMRESEERFRSLIDHNPDGVYSFDRKGNFLSVNDAACKISGYSREEFMQMNFTHLVVPEDLEMVSRHFEKAIDGAAQDYETTIVRKDGCRVALNVTNTPMKVKGEIIGAYGIAKDITQARKAAESLMESEERFRSLFDRSLDCVYVIDFEGRIIDANSVAYDLLGYGKSELQSMRIASLIDRNQLPYFLKRSKDLIQTGIQNDLYEYKIRRKDGMYVDFETTASIIYRDGKPHSILGIARDVTERKRMDAYQQQSFKQLRKALGATVQAIAVMVETRDPYTAGHQKRVADLARAIATEMKLSGEQIDGIRTAGMIHDIGKIAVPAEILSKPSKLSDLEFSMIKTHSQSGHDILKDIEFPWPIARIVLEHHERMDGSGYPNGVTGDNLLIESKVLAVADVVEAMASHRPYRAGLGIDAALDEIVSKMDRHYYPKAVNACVRLFRNERYTLSH